MEWKENTTIVVIGGGTGLSTLLRGLKKYPLILQQLLQ